MAAVQVLSAALLPPLEHAPLAQRVQLRLSAPAVCDAAVETPAGARVQSLRSAAASDEHTVALVGLAAGEEFVLRASFLVDGAVQGQADVPFAVPAVPKEIRSSLLVCEAEKRVPGVLMTTLSVKPVHVRNKCVHC